MKPKLRLGLKAENQMLTTVIPATAPDFNVSDRLGAVYGRD